MPENIRVFDATSRESLRDLRTALQASFDAAAIQDEDDVSGDSHAIAAIPEFEELLGIDAAVYRQLNAALKSGKRHIMLYGPPGTGKTTLARLLAGYLADNWKLITASADWSSQDIIGGYMPLADGSLIFFPGVLLEHFNKPLVIDELNRCDIDKVIGPLFTVLSGQSTTLPYLTDPSDASSPRFTILPEPKANPAENEFAPSGDWRIIATINTVDKASLYQMSYALSRRFAWIFVDVPGSPSSFLREWLVRESIVTDDAASALTNPLGEVWRAVAEVRPMGPAPALDACRYLTAAADDPFDFLSPIEATGDARIPLLIDVFLVFFLPMLDGISRQEGELIVEQVKITLALSPEQEERIRQALSSVCV